MTSRSSLPRLLLGLTFVALSQAGCLGWDTARSEYCGGTPDPRPEECGPRTLGLRTALATVFGETGFDTRATGLAAIGPQLFVASELSASGLPSQQARLTLYSPNGTGATPALSLSYESQGSGMVHLAGVASDSGHVFVAGYYQAVLGAPGVGVVQTSMGGDRPFLQVLDLGGNSVGFWSRDPSAQGSASVLSVSAAVGTENPEILIVGTFTGDLQFDGLPAVHSNPGGAPSLFAAIAQWDGTSIVFRRSWAAVADPPGSLELLDAKLAPDGVACLAVRANGSVLFDGGLSGRSYSAPTLALLCAKPDGTTVGTDLFADDVRIAPLSGSEFYVAFTSSRGLEAGVMQVQATTVNVLQGDSLALGEAGIALGAIDARPDGSRLLLGTYHRPFAPGPGLRLADPQGRDLFLLRVSPVGQVVGATAYHQDGDFELPVGLIAQAGGASFLAQIGSGPMIDLGPEFQLGYVASTPHVLVTVGD